MEAGEEARRNLEKKGLAQRPGRPQDLANCLWSFRRMRKVTATLPDQVCNFRRQTDTGDVRSWKEARVEAGRRGRQDDGRQAGWGCREGHDWDSVKGPEYLKISQCLWDVWVLRKVLFKSSPGTLSPSTQTIPKAPRHVWSALTSAIWFVATAIETTRGTWGRGAPHWADSTKISFLKES